MNVLIALKKFNNQSNHCRAFKTLQDKEDFTLRDDLQLIFKNQFLSLYLAFRNDYKYPYLILHNMPR